MVSQTNQLTRVAYNIWSLNGLFCLFFLFFLVGNPFRRLKYRSLQQLLEQKYRLETSEAKGLADFLLPMLAFEPDKRPNAKEFAHHPWLVDTKPTRPFP